MKLIPKRIYKSIISSLLVVLLLLSIVLVITTTVFGTRTDLEVKRSFGKYDAKNKVFYPNFDDEDVNGIYESSENKGKKVGLYYSDIFKNADKSFSKYYFSSDGESGFFPLNSKTKKITLEHKTKYSFNKKKSFDIAVNWKNVLFVKDENLKEIAAVKKTRLIENYNFKTLERAYEVRLKRQEEGSKEKIDFSKYYLATTFDSNGKQISLFSNPDAVTFSVSTTEEKRKVLENTNYLKIINAFKSSSNKYPVFIFEVNGNNKELIDFQERSDSYAIPASRENIKYRKWGMSNRFIEYLEDEEFDNLHEGQTISINGPTYLYAFLNNGKRLVKVNVQYEFEVSDKHYQINPHFATLENSRIKVNSKVGELISTRKFDAYSEDRDTRLVMSDNDDWKKEKKGYDDKNVAIYYTTDKKTTETQVKNGNMLDDGSESYNIIFRYKRKGYTLEFRDDTKNRISNPEDVGLTTFNYKYNDQITINPYGLSGGKIFAYWLISRKVDNKDIESETIVGGKFTLDADHISDDGKIKFNAFSESDEKLKIYIKYYKETEVTDKFEISHTKLLASGEGQTFYKGAVIDNLKNIIINNKGTGINIEYESTPVVYDERQNTKITDLDNVVFDKHDFMTFKVNYRKSRNTIIFKESESGEGVLSGDKFSSIFIRQSDIKYGDTLTKVLGGKNKKGTQYLFRSGNDVIGTITLLGWRPINSAYNIYSDNDGFFDIESYKNQDSENDKKTIELYPVWKHEVNLYVTIYLSDSRKGIELVLVDGATKKYKLSYRFQYKLNNKFKSDYKFDNNDLKKKIKDIVGEELQNNPNERELYEHYREVFDFEKIAVDNSGNSIIELSKTEINKFEVYVNRYQSQLKFKLNFEDENINKVAQYLSLNPPLQPFELNGLGNLDYVIPKIEIDSKAVDVTDSGQHLANIKTEIDGIDKPTELFPEGENKVFEPYKFEVKNKLGDHITSGEYTKFTVGEVLYQQGTVIIINYRPCEFIIEYDMGNYTVPSDAPGRARYLEKVVINAPKVKGDVFMGWKYEDKDISPSLIKYNKLGDKIISAEYIMPASKIKLRPIFGKAIYTKAHVAVRIQDEKGNFKKHTPEESYLIGPHEDIDQNMQHGRFFKKRDEDNPSYRPEIGDYTKPEKGKLPNFDYSYLYFDESDNTMPGVGKFENEGGKYYFNFAPEYNGFDAEIVVTFRRFVITVCFKPLDEHDKSSNPNINITGLPETKTVYFGGKLEAGDYDPNMNISIDGKLYNVPFRGYSLDSQELTASVKRNATNFVFDREAYKRHGAIAYLYARWHAVQNVRIYASLEFEQLSGGTYEVLSTLSELELTQRVNLPFDGQPGSNIKPNDLRRDLSQKIPETVGRPYLTDTDSIISLGEGEENYELILGRNVIPYRLNRKRVRVKFVLPEGSNPASIAEQTVIFGAKLQPVISPQYYKALSWEGSTKATFKYFTRESIDYIGNYSDDKPKFEVSSYVFDQDTDFMQSILNIYTVWNKAQNIPVKLRVYGETPAKETVIEQVAEGMSDFYTTSKVVTDGNGIRPSEILPYLKGVMNKTVYDENNIEFRYNGALLQLTDEAIASLTQTNTNLTIEVYLKRIIRTVTLDAPGIVNADNVVGAVVKENDNKILKFKHGYRFTSDETPTVNDTEDDQFMGWTYLGTTYTFSDGKEILSDMIIKADMQKKYSLLNINLNGLRGNGLHYSDSGVIIGSPAEDWSKISLKIPHDRLPYTLDSTKLLKLNSEEHFYFEVTQRQVSHTGYSGQTLISERGKTYNVDAVFSELLDIIYKGLYPQTKIILEGNINMKPQEAVSLKYGSVIIQNAYNKGYIYEVLEVDGIKEYFRYEKVKLVQVPKNESQYWTYSNIDFSIYDLNNNNYDESYIKQYLERVIKKKMQLSASQRIELPIPNGSPTMEEGGLNNIGHEELKVKEISDFSRAMSKPEVYVKYRNLNNSNIAFSSPAATWLGIVKPTGGNEGAFMLYPAGESYYRHVHYAFGLRPVLPRDI